jgi:hypothetical protein
MPKIVRPTQSIRDRAEAEHAVAQTLKNEANIEFIALMTDVELPDNAEEGLNNADA